MATVIIVQARYSSTRLRGKILKPFFGETTLLELLVNKLKQLKGCDIIIATSHDWSNDPIEELCKELEVKCFRGAENDVLQRFIDAATHFGYEKIVRICSDNPFLEFKALEQLLGAADKNPDANYISFKVGDSPSILTHYGFWAEYTTLSTLKKVKQMTKDALYYEHVTNFIYTHPKDFKLSWLPTPNILGERKKLRLTIDTASDFETAQQIYAEVTKYNPLPTIEQVVEYIDNHLEYYSKMEQEIINNSK